MSPALDARLSHTAGTGAELEHNEEVFARLDPRVMARFYRFVRPYRGRLLAALVSVAGFTVAQLTIPIVIRDAVDAAITGRQAALFWTLLLFAGVVAVNMVFNFLQEWVAARLAQRVIFDLRRAMFAHLQAVDLAFLDRTQVGRLMSRLQGDVNALQEFLEQSVSAAGDSFLVVGISIMLVYLDWQLGLLTLTLLPILFGIRALWLPWARERFRRARDASSTLNAALAENINGIRTVQESLREAINFERFRVKAETNYRAQIASAGASQIMVPIVDILTGIAMAIVVYVGTEAVLGGRLGVGAMVAYLFYIQRFFDPIRTLSMQYTVLQRAVASAHRIFEVLDVPIEIKDRPCARVLDVMAGKAVPSIELSHVTFGYRPGQPVLHDVSFRIEPYQTVAIVGPTGSGKSSIISLVHRFYDVWQGEVRIGGQDVREATLDSLGEAIAMVLQEPFLFSGTIGENIRFHSADATEADIVAAAKAVHAHDFIMRLPQAYETPLGQRGRNLSVGQRQLISFARALVANPKILILDEATANIDSFTELEIQRALKVLLRGRTSLVIAHRLATIRDADRILVLKAGRIIEDGTHDQLVEAGGLYAELHRSHAGSFNEI